MGDMHQGERGWETAHRQSRKREGLHDAVDCRRQNRSALRQRRFWGAYLVLAFSVIAVTAFGIASAGNLLPGQHGAHLGRIDVQVDHASPDSTYPKGAGGSDGDESAAALWGDDSSDSGGLESAQQSSSERNNPEHRVADFAVDSTKTDWNFSTNGRKTVYLTIDDGPSENTQALHP